MKDVRCLEVYARLNVTETRFYFSIHLSTREYHFFFKHLPPKLYMRKQHETKIERKVFISLLCWQNCFCTLYGTLEFKYLHCGLNTHTALFEN